MTIRLAHIAAVLAISTIIATVGGVIATYLIAEAEIRDLSDEDIERHADLLAHWLALQDVLPTGLARQLQQAFEEDDEDTLWIIVEHHSSGQRVSNLAGGGITTETVDGELRRDFAGHRWQGYQVTHGEIAVQVLQRADRFTDVREEVAEHIVAPAIAVGAVNLALLGVLIALCLWPLARLVRALERRRGDRLEAIRMAAPAYEIAALRDTLNRLFADAADVLARERRFTDDVAHELRTPLTTLKLELAGESTERETLVRQVTRMERVVTRLLALARLAHGEHAVALAPLDLGHVLQSLAVDLDARATCAGMRFKSSLISCAVRGDATLLGVLVENLVSNSIAHCPEGTLISLRVDVADGATRLQVEDDGPGLAPAVLKQIGGDFERLDSRGGGLGLGLAMCHRIVKLHGAIIEIGSRTPSGRGLVVEVRFPALRAT